MTEHPSHRLTPSMRLAEIKAGRPLHEYLAQRYHHDGLTVEQIGAELGVAGSTVWRWLPAVGIAARRPGQKAAAR